MSFHHTLDSTRWTFADLREVLAKASPNRSGDQLAGLSAISEVERIAARHCLADVPLRRFLNELVIPYEADEVTRLIVDTHDTIAFAPIAHLTVGGFRDWLLSESAGTATSAVSVPKPLNRLHCEGPECLGIGVSPFHGSAVRGSTQRRVYDR